MKVSRKILLFLLVLGFGAYAQGPVVDFAEEARLLTAAILVNHVQPAPVDDAFSVWVYDQVLNELDPERIYFTQADIATLVRFRDQLDDELNGDSWSFLPLLTQAYQTSLERYQQGIAGIGQVPTDFSGGDFFQADKTWVATPLVLQEQWKRIFRYNMFDRLLELKRRHPVRTEQELRIQDEKSVRQQVEKVMLRDAYRTMHHEEGFVAYVASQYLKAIAAYFDPHTTYFSPNEVRDFVSSLSTEGYYFGITLGENERGEVTITQLMPGGPAWKSGEVHAGDVIQVVQWEGQEAIDLWGFSMQEVNGILAETNHTAITFTLREKDGTDHAVRLQKEKIVAEETQVKTFMLDGGHKIGYISLPDFYTNWDDQAGSQCARDVAREVLKLKNEHIEGLILDLRFNGGGAMDEAVAMAGIFIDAGPVGVIKDRTGEMRTMKDINRGTVYDGPLVLMVNGLSASASEFLAAALQDYHRAVIVGGRTYGKATAQTLSPINGKLPPSGMPDLSNADQSYSSITLEKMYRITGKTAQRSGVVPDIILHDALEALPIRESDLPRAFPSDSISKKTYYQPLAMLPLKDLKARSAGRVQTQPQFTALQTYGRQIAELEHHDDKVSLVWDDFKTWYDAEMAIVAGVEKSSAAGSSAFKASRLQAVEQRMQMDAYTDEFNRMWIKNLQDDIFVNEAFLIICDFIPSAVKK